MSARSSRFVLVTQQRPTAPPVGPKAALGASIGYALAVFTLLASGSLVLVGRAPLADHVDEVKMPAGGQTTCLRASRHADYASVWLPVGTPVRIAELLLRLDSVVATPAEALTLRSHILSQSQTIVCANTSVCTDVLILEPDRPGSAAVQLVSDGFLFQSSQSASFSGSTMGLDGELKLVRGYDYWLTTTHFCWSPIIPSELPDTFTNRRSVYSASTTTGVLTVDASSPLAPAECGDLGMSTVLFPLGASYELTWLSMASRYVYEHSTEALRRRREAVSLGQVCAESQQQYATTGALDSAVWIDCQHTVCQQGPSVTFRTLLAQASLFVRLPEATSTNATLVVHRSATLGRIPDLLDPESATVLSVLRLLLMLLAAAITFIRSSQASSNSVAIMMRSFERGCRLDAKRTGLFQWSDIVTNAAIGLTAVVARGIVIILMADALNEDCMQTIVIAEVAGSVASLLHFVLRHCLETNLKIELPLTKLGGPMSIVDVACAILLVFSEAPLLATMQSFSAVGRLLSALLLVVTCSNLSVFAATSCSMLAPVVQEEGDADSVWYARALVASSLLWFVQIASLSVTFACAFARPFAYALQRGGLGDGQLIIQSVFWGVLCAGLPTGNRVVLSFCQHMNTRLQERADSFGKKSE